MATLYCCWSPQLGIFALFSDYIKTPNQYFDMLSSLHWISLDFHVVLLCESWGHGSNITRFLTSYYTYTFQFSELTCNTETHIGYDGRKLGSVDRGKEMLFVWLCKLHQSCCITFFTALCYGYWVYCQKGVRTHRVWSGHNRSASIAKIREKSHRQN